MKEYRAFGIALLAAIVMVCGGNAIGGDGGSPPAAPILPDTDSMRWTDVSGELGYIVQRDTGTGYHTLDTLPADSLFYKDDSGECGWTYKVIAYNDAGQGESNPVTATCGPEALALTIKGIAQESVVSGGDTAAFYGIGGYGANTTFGGACPRGDSTDINVIVLTDTLTTADSSTTNIAGALVNGLDNNKLDIIVSQISGYNDMLNFGSVEVTDSCLIVAGQTAPGPFWFGGGSGFNFGVRVVYLTGTNKHQVWRGIRMLGSQSIADGGSNTTMFQVGAEGDLVDHILVADNFMGYCGDTCLQPQSGDGSGGANNNTGFEDKHDILFDRNLFAFSFKTGVSDQGSKRMSYVKNVMGPGTRHRLPEYGEGDTVEVINNILVPNSNDKRMISVRQPDTVATIETDIIANLTLSGRGSGDAGGVNVRPFQVGNSDSDTTSSINMLIYAFRNVADSTRGTNGLGAGDKPDSTDSAWGNTASNTGCFVKDTDGFCEDSTVFKLASAAAAPAIAVSRWSAWQAWDTLIVNQKVGAWFSVDSLGQLVDTRDEMQDTLLDDIVNGLGEQEEDSAKLYWSRTSDGFPHGTYADNKFTLGSDADNGTGDGMPDAYEDACGFNTSSDDAWKVDAGFAHTRIERWLNAFDDFGINVHFSTSGESFDSIRAFVWDGSWAYDTTLTTPDTLRVIPTFSRGDSIYGEVYNSGSLTATSDTVKVGCY